MEKIDDDSHLRLDMRLAGQLKRYHTWMITGQQTVAEHCWQIMRIYLSVVDKPDLNMIYHIVYHDIGETFTGDVPYPVKRDNSALKEQIEFLEHKSQAAQMQYWNCFKPILLTDTDKMLFKQIELIEMAEFGLDQMTLGNYHGYPIADRCLRVVFNNGPSRNIAEYVIKRLRLFHQQMLKDYYYLDTENTKWWFTKAWEDLHAGK